MIDEDELLVALVGRISGWWRQRKKHNDINVASEDGGPPSPGAENRPSGDPYRIPHLPFLH